MPGRGRVPRRWLVAGSLVLASSSMLASAASAQAFLPLRGEGTISFLLQDTLGDRHLLGDRRRIDAGEAPTDRGLLYLTYGITYTTAVSLTLPYLAAKYVGSNPHPGSLI